ncbi:MFS transporter [Planctomicrobium sp. SH661]|uniref:MFS transporter n=1 Tax=Planctomicrobium sp. SH661 TaxID=3448124 RepID=UPI003F5C1B22
MSSSQPTVSIPAPAAVAERTTMGILLAISASHLLNDTLQSVLVAIYPVLKEAYQLSFADIGLIGLTSQLTASMLQPVVGFYTDRRPKPYSLALGMGSTLCGLILLSLANTLGLIMFAAGMVGLGSSIFHPEASRIARLASGGRHGFAQALFQVGGNFGSSLGPLLAAWIIVPQGQRAIAWFALLAVLAIGILVRIGHWYQDRLVTMHREKKAGLVAEAISLPRGKVLFAIGILVVLVISKYFYLVSLTSYYTFYLMHRFHVSVQTSQLCLFVFLFSVAAGTIAGGPLGDRFGRKLVIWFSILGVAPFSLILPYVDFTWTVILSSIIGVILASAFSAILVFAQDLMPGKVGLVAGMFFGFAFGVSGIAAALLGDLADHTSIEYVFSLCSFLPLAGLVTGFLPNIQHPARAGDGG